MGPVAIVLGSVFLTAAIFGLVAWLTRSGRELGRVTVVSGKAFTLTVPASQITTATLWCDVDLGWSSAPDLRGPLTLRVDGRVAWEGSFALDRRGGTVAGEPRIKKVWIVGGAGAHGVTRVARVDVDPGAGALTVEGTIAAGEGTEVRRLELFVGGY